VTCVVCRTGSERETVDQTIVQRAGVQVSAGRGDGRGGGRGDVTM